MTATTARKPRTPRKPSATADIVPRSPFGRHDTAAGLIWRAQVASAPSVVAMDWDAFDDAFASYAADEDDGREAARKQADAAHAVVNSGRDVRDRYDGHAYQAAYTGSMSGCGDEPWTDPVAALGVHGQGPGDPTVDKAIAGIAQRGPVRFREPSNVVLIPPLEDDPEAEKHFQNAGLADGDCPELDEPEPEPEPETEPETALDEAHPLSVGDWKTGSDEKDGEIRNG